MTELNRLIGQLDNIAERTEAGVSEKYDAESIREAARILRAAASVDVAGLMELAAKAIYDQWADQLGWVEWVPGGNSLNQDEARSIARAALESALRMALAAREGFVLVPVEPTPEMVDAARTLTSWPDGVYRAMLAAAPKGTP